MARSVPLYRKARGRNRIPVVANLIVSNVPGPQMPLYLAGARVKSYYPVSAVAHGLGLNITIVSYDGSLDFGLVAAKRRCRACAVRAAISRRRMLNCWPRPYLMKMPIQRSAQGPRPAPPRAGGARAVGIRRRLRSHPLAPAQARAATAMGSSSSRASRRPTSARAAARVPARARHDSRGWKLKRNFGPARGILEQSVEQVREMRRRTGRKVSLVGWSLGGIYAREIAKALPMTCAASSTLATPFTGSPLATNVWRIYELLSGHSLDDRALLAQVREPPPVPTTSIFSRTDGIVAWRCSLEKRAHQVENVEVPASHFGIGLNPAAWFAVADRLAQPEDGWTPFHRDGWRRWIYADPHRVG
jgi:hypothetical protein